MGNNMPPDANDYVIRVVESPLHVDAASWDALLYTQADAPRSCSAPMSALTATSPT